MALDPRTPVLVGAGQVGGRAGDETPVTRRPEPVDLMARALEAAAEDCGSRRAGRRLLERAQTLRVLRPLSWRYANPGLLVSDRLGIAPSELSLTDIGGNNPQTVASRTALDIAEGEVDVALVTGAECIATRVAARRDPAKPTLTWTTQPEGTAAPVVLGTERDPVTDAEAARGLDRPLRVFPLFENALRAQRAESIADHGVRISELWSAFSAVATHNPYAWSQQTRTAGEIRTAGPANRMIAFPYTKLMNANDRVDQGAAFILCSVAAARDAGVPQDRWVFPVAGADAHDHWFLSERADLWSAPALRLAGRRAFELARKGIDDVGHVDLYSCFPCAVQIGAAELGLRIDDPGRALTVTGGLAFAGGPGNNYVTHSIATMAARLRADPGALGLVTGLGWYLTKHAVGLWSTSPPVAGFRHGVPQDEVDVLPRRSPAPGQEGDVTIETYTVVHDRDGRPELGILALLTEEGGRTWGNTTDVDVLDELMTEEGCGRRARLRADGTAELH